MSMSLADYRRLPYTRMIDKVTEQDGTYFVAFIAEIPWVRVYADDPTTALYELDLGFDDCIGAMIQTGDEVPRPVMWPESLGLPELPAARGRKRLPAPEVTCRTPDEVEPWEDAAAYGDSRLTLA